MATEEETKGKIKSWLNEVLDERQAARDKAQKEQDEKDAKEKAEKKPTGIFGGILGGL